MLLWLVTDDARLSPTVKKIYLNSRNSIFLSMASVWELAIKRSLNKISLPESLRDFVHKHIIDCDIQILKIELAHLYSLESLPFHHRDPFDRLIVSQAIQEKLTVISADRTFDLYPIKCVR